MPVLPDAFLLTTKKGKETRHGSKILGEDESGAHTLKREKMDAKSPRKGSFSSTDNSSGTYSTVYSTPPLYE